MWIKGIDGLINTEYVRDVTVYQPATDVMEWDLVATFNNRDRDMTIDRYKTEKEANAALDWFYKLLTNEYVYQSDWEKGRHDEEYRQSIAKVEAESIARAIKESQDA
jgi:hypothetical protein